MDVVGLFLELTVVLDCKLFSYLAISWTTKLSIFLIAILIGGHHVLLYPQLNVLTGS